MRPSHLRWLEMYHFKTTYLENKCLSKTGLILEQDKGQFRLDTDMQKIFLHYVEQSLFTDV